MAQFDIHPLDDGLLVVDLQTDLIGLDATRLVAPLRTRDRYAAFPGLTPEIAFDDVVWVLRLPEMAAVRAGELGTPVGSAAAHQDEIKRGIDILIHGF